MVKKFVAIAIVFISTTACLAADNAAIKKEAKARVEQLNKAVVQNDFEKIADLTHPKVVELLGGRKAMLEMMQKGSKEMASQGVKFESVAVAEPSEPVAGGAELFLTVPFTLKLKVPNGKLTQHAFVVGISADHGKSWHFVDGTNPELVKHAIPNLPDQLKLPERQQPTFEKD